MFTHEDLPIVRGCDRSAADRLATKNEKLVDYVLNRRFPFLTDDDDARQAARIALWRAAGRFDPSKGYTFTTYAFECIRGALLRHLKQDSGRREAGRLTCARSLDEAATADIDLTFGKSVPDQNSGAGYATILARESLRSMSVALKGKRRDVFTAVYLEGATINDLAAVWNVTPAAVTQLHRAAVRDIARVCPEEVSALHGPA